jgi:DNA (cytosine-5)-methyltransferase 1
MRLRTLDRFCGGGGSSWGAAAAGAEIVCGVDGWELAARTFGTNFRKATAVEAVLTEDSGPEVVGRIGKIDLILASPECTNHTCAKGNRPREEASKRTARYLLNFARKLKPRFMVLENVVHMRGWHGYDPLVKELERLDYFVRPQVLDAVDFGVPQTRRRLFLLCDRERLPTPVRLPRRRVRVAREILDPEGKWQTRALYDPKRAAPTLRRAERAIAELGKGVPFLIVYYGSDGSGGWQSLDRPLRTLTTLDRFGLVTWQGAKPMLRMLQVPELQRAMGLGADFRLEHGNRRDKIRLLGNGVCAPVMEAVVSSLTTTQQPAREALVLA